MAADRIVVGTSSWVDPGFVADCSPESLAAAEQRPFCVERFERVHVLFENHGLADAPGPPARHGQLELATGRS